MKGHRTNLETLERYGQHSLISHLQNFRPPNQIETNHAANIIPPIHFLFQNFDNFPNRNPNLQSNFQINNKSMENQASIQNQIQIQNLSQPQYQCYPSQPYNQLQTPNVSNPYRSFSFQQDTSYNPFTSNGIAQGNEKYQNSPKFHETKDLSMSIHHALNKSQRIENSSELKQEMYNTKVGSEFSSNNFKKRKIVILSPEIGKNQVDSSGHSQLKDFPKNFKEKPQSTRVNKFDPKMECSSDNEWDSNDENNTNNDLSIKNESQSGSESESESENENENETQSENENARKTRGRGPRRSQNESRKKNSNHTIESQNSNSNSNNDNEQPVVRKRGRKSTRHPHLCPLANCKREFKRMEHLKRHWRIHTGERSYHCPFPNCPKGFSRQDNLTQHLKTHLKSEVISDNMRKKLNELRLPPSLMSLLNDIQSSGEIKKNQRKERRDLNTFVS